MACLQVRDIPARTISRAVSAIERRKDTNREHHFSGREAHRRPIGRRGRHRFPLGTLKLSGVGHCSRSARINLAPGAACNLGFARRQTTR